MKIFTDGSCYYKSRAGGLGVYILKDDGSEVFISEGYQPTTISRMEGFALLRALQTLPSLFEERVDLYSDSEYVIKTFTEGRHIRWQMMNFIGVANEDMWRKIFREMSRIQYTIHFHHIKGHQKDITDELVFGNNMADLLSNYKNFKTYKNDKEL